MFSLSCYEVVVKYRPPAPHLFTIKEMQAYRQTSRLDSGSQTHHLTLVPFPLSLPHTQGQLNLFHQSALCKMKMGPESHYTSMWSYMIKML